MAKYEGEATPKSLTGRREDTGFASLQPTFPPSSVYDPIGSEQMQFQSAPMTYPAYSGPSSSGLGRPGASRMEPTSSGVGIPPSGVLATGPPAMRSEGYASQGFASQGYATMQGSGGPSLYAPQLSVPAQETVSMEAINTHETNTTLDNFPVVSGLQPVPYTGVDPPTPPQALSQLDLNATVEPNVWPSTQPGFNSFQMDAGPPGTITTVAPRSMAGASSSDPPRSGVVSFQSLPAQGVAPNYPAFAPQSSSVPPGSISTVMDNPRASRSGGGFSPRAARPFEPMQSATKSGTWQPEVRTSDRMGSQSKTQSEARPYSGKVKKADGSITDSKSSSKERPKSKKFTPTTPPTPSTIKPSLGTAKILSEKDIGSSKLDQPKDDDSEKENLISEIRERDVTIARLLREVREKRATRMRDVEALSDRMDYLEARLLSQHLDVMK